MTQTEYEARRDALEQQLQADIALLQAAHEVRVRSLEASAGGDGEGPAVRQMVPVQAQVPAAAAPPPKRQPARPLFPAGRRARHRCNIPGTRRASILCRAGAERRRSRGDCLSDKARGTSRGEPLRSPPFFKGGAR